MELKGSLPHSPFPILNQINPVHAPSHFLKIHFNIIFPFTSGLSKQYIIIILTTIIIIIIIVGLYSLSLYCNSEIEKESYDARGSTPLVLGSYRLTGSSRFPHATTRSTDCLKFSPGDPVTVRITGGNQRVIIGQKYTGLSGDPDFRGITVVM